MKEILTREIRKKRMEYLYAALSALGMNTILRRFIFGVIIGLGVEWFFKPFWSWDEEGAMRPWAILDGGEAGSTYLPVLAFPLLLGFLFGFFI
jgi:hypothetical protein